MPIVYGRRIITVGFVGIFLRVLLLPAQAALPLVGADLSALQTLEEWGAIYRSGGKSVDALVYLQNQGMNCFRLRLFVSPDGKELVTNSLPYTLALARRVKAAGAQFILDIHYSDTWADPGQQAKPAAWSKMDFDTLVETVKDYTHQVLARFRAEGVSPDFVQLGNEITNGMLWPEGRVEYLHADAAVSWTRLGQLLRAARSGLDAAYPEGARPQVILHIESAREPERSNWFFQQALEHGVAFDIAAFSYYPEWHGTPAQLRNTLSSVAKTFHKPILVAETAYPWKNDEHWRGRPHLDWPLTPAGQQTFLRDVSRVVEEVPEGLGLGLIYWHPEAIAVGANPCWIGGSCALFAANGEALPAASFARDPLTPVPIEEKSASLSSAKTK